jgi:hypothetical protein
MTQRLNIGCGRDIRSGWINVDRRPNPGVDVVLDIDLAQRWPFDDGAFQEVLCQDVLEHIAILPVMAELHRVTAPGAAIHVRCPHFSSRVAHVDPTHRRGFSVASFSYFAGDGASGEAGYLDTQFDRVEGATIVLPTRRALPWNPLVQRWINRSESRQSLYEESALVSLFPALNIELDLIR